MKIGKTAAMLIALIALAEFAPPASASISSASSSGHDCSGPHVGLPGNAVCVEGSVQLVSDRCGADTNGVFDCLWDNCVSQCYVDCNWSVRAWSEATPLIPGYVEAWVCGGIYLGHVCNFPGNLGDLRTLNTCQASGTIHLGPLYVSCNENPIRANTGYAGQATTGERINVYPEHYTFKLCSGGALSFAQGWGR